MTAAVHTHKPAHPLRAFVGRPGVYVQCHGDWIRPLNVWLYRGAWRTICRPCMTPVQSGDELYDGGWPTQAAAFDAAVAHCSGCPTTNEINQPRTGAPR